MHRQIGPIEIDYHPDRWRIDRSMLILHDRRSSQAYVSLWPTTMSLREATKRAIWAWRHEDIPDAE